jgi:hypothetical protein
MTNIDIANHIKAQYLGQKLITTHEITKAIMDAYPDAAPSTLAWRIFQLKKEHLICQVGRGLYSFEFKPEFIPEISAKTKRFYKRIKHLSSEMSIWDTSSLSPISNSPITKLWIFIAAPKDELDGLYDQMLDYSKQVFLHADKEVLQRYMLAQDEAIILTPLISEAPIYKADDFVSFTLEGLLVNVLFETESYLEAIGVNIIELFKQAFDKYNVNRSKLLRYASRRDKKQEIENIIKIISKDGK